MVVKMAKGFVANRYLPNLHYLHKTPHINLLTLSTSIYQSVVFFELQNNVSSTKFGYVHIGHLVSEKWTFCRLIDPWLDGRELDR